MAGSQLSYLTLHEIFRNLDYETLTNFRQTCTMVDYIIRSRRYFYKKKSVRRLRFWYENNEKEMSMTLDNGQYKSMSITDDLRLNQFIYSIEPKLFCFTDNDNILQLHRKWWENIEVIEIYFELPRLTNYFKYFGNCSNLCLHYKYKMKGMEILDNMKFVENLTFKRQDGPGLFCDDAFIYSIIEKAENGKGINKMFLDLSEDSHISVDSVIRLILKGKFSNCSRILIHLTHVFGSREQLSNALFRSNDVSAFADHELYYLIRRNNFEIIFTCDRFVTI